MASRKSQQNGTAWWCGGDRPPLELHMLMVSEVAEATEEARKGTLPIYYNTEHGVLPREDGMFDVKQGDKLLKPEGEAVELADVVIRIADYFAWTSCSCETVALSAKVRSEMEECVVATKLMPRREDDYELIHLYPDYHGRYVRPDEVQGMSTALEKSQKRFDPHGRDVREEESGPARRGPIRTAYSFRRGGSE